jgi:hypothetical protein
MARAAGGLAPARRPAPLGYPDACSRQVESVGSAVGHRRRFRFRNRGDFDRRPCPAETAGDPVDMLISPASQPTLARSILTEFKASPYSSRRSATILYGAGSPSIASMKSSGS